MHDNEKSTDYKKIEGESAKIIKAAMGLDNSGKDSVEIRSFEGGRVSITGHERLRTAILEVTPRYICYVIKDDRKGIVFTTNFNKERDGIKKETRRYRGLPEKVIITDREAAKAQLLAYVSGVDQALARAQVGLTLPNKVCLIDPKQVRVKAEVTQQSKVETYPKTELHPTRAEVLAALYEIEWTSFPHP